MLFPGMECTPCSRGQPPYHQAMDAPEPLYMSKEIGLTAIAQTGMLKYYLRNVEIENEADILLLTHDAKEVKQKGVTHKYQSSATMFIKRVAI